jgi:hypothetical protein
METPKPLLKNLGAKLRQMMAEDWRGEDERNTLGMAGHWLEKLAEDSPPNPISFTVLHEAITGKNEQKNARCSPCKIRENENK